MGLFPSFGTMLRLVVGSVAVGLVSAAGLLYTYQRSIIYPSAFPEDSRTVVDTPDMYELPYKEEFLETPDHEKLQTFAMLQQDASGDTATARERPTLVMLHANAGNMGHRLPLAVVFYRRLGCNVVMLSYRGYGRSSGEPSETGIKVDAQTLMDWLRKHPVLSGTPFVLYGQSIGGAVATFLAAHNPSSVRALILENTFLSIPQLIPSILPALAPFTFLCREVWPSFELIQKLPRSMPVLFLSGEKDEVVPRPHMVELHRTCPSENKEWHSFPAGTHNDTCVKPKYFDIIAAFLLKYVIDIDAVYHPPNEEDDDWVKMGASDVDAAKRAS